MSETKPWWAGSHWHCDNCGVGFKDIDIMVCSGQYLTAPNDPIVDPVCPACSEKLIKTEDQS